MLDVRDTPVSTDDAAALAGFEQALRSFQTFVGDPVAQLDKVLAKSPDFILAHLFRALAFYLSSEQRYRAPALQSVQAAQALLAHANHREQLLYTAVQTLVDGQWRVASQAFDAVLCDYPRDVLALQAGHLLDFFTGDALNLRNRPARVLPQWQEDMPGYSYVLGMYAFGLEECNQYAMAEDYGRQALALDPVDAWSVHAVTHVMEMMGRSQEGITFLRERQADWSEDNGFAYHNWWHMALLHLEHHEDAEVLQIYDQHICTDGDITLSLLDATALLWRLQLMGVALDGRLQPVAQSWADKLETEAGYYAFNDFHAALAFCGTDNAEQLGVLEHHLQHHAGQQNNANVAMTGQVGLPLVRGMRAYLHGDFAQAVNCLAPVKDIAHQFGGSHAQRDVINLTLLSAAAKAGETNLVRHLGNERLMLKPDTVLAQRVLQAAQL